MIRCLLFIILSVNASGCSYLDIFKIPPAPKNFSNLVINCKNMSKDPALFLNSSPKIEVFLVTKPYLITSGVDEALQDLAIESGVSERGALSCYIYNVMPEEVMNYKIEIIKNVSFMIVFFKKDEVVISKTSTHIFPAQTKLINLVLVDKQVKIIKNN